MIVFLIAVVAITLFTSMICSLVEAAIYSVPLGHVKALAENGSRAGEILLRFKDDIARPISLILLMNTMANSVGPLVAGWLVGAIFNQSGIAVIMFSVVFAVLILVVGEFIPKTLGVVYCRSVAVVAAVPIAILIKFFSPVLYASQYIQSLLARSSEEPTVSHEEVLSMAAIGTEEGALDDFEGSVISNVIGLDKLLVKDVLTPRVVVLRLSEETMLGEIEKDLPNWQFTRIPIFSVSDPDHLSGYVTQRDIYRGLLSGDRETRLKSIARPLETVPELMPVDKLLLQMFEHKEHICAVVDEHGGLAGIITLEDILEELIGLEIVDEYDEVSDLRSFAKILRVSKKKNRDATRR